MNKTSDSLFLVTGATGNTGDPTVRLLLERGHRVRAFVHRDEAIHAVRVERETHDADGRCRGELLAAELT